MLYSFAFTIPANTPQAVPLISYKRLNCGNINKISIQIPAGHVGLTGLKIFDEETQIYPINKESYIVGNDVFLDIAENYDLKNPGVLKILGWNTDELFEHTFYIYISLFPISFDVPISKNEVIKVQNDHDFFDWLRGVFS